jgi:hypothetical protein
LRVGALCKTSQAVAQTPAPRRRLLPLALAACVVASMCGCATAQRPAAPTQPAESTPPAETTAAPVSALATSNRADVAAAQEVVLAYVEALRSAQASDAAALMTSYRRPETRAKGWRREVRWWKNAQLKTIVHPGRYVSDERAFAQLYAEHFGRPPYKLVVLNVRYGLGPGTPPGDTDFVVTRHSAGAPWLVHDFGGALRPEPAPATTP